MANVKIVHPELGPDSAHEVPGESLPHHYRAGWRLLTDEEATAADAPAPEPKPMTKAQAAKAARNAGNEE